jgi:hypothetical protein
MTQVLQVSSTLCFPYALRKVFFGQICMFPKKPFLFAASVTC